MKIAITKLAKIEPENLAETSRLFERVREILDAAKSNVARSVNTEMVRAYWQIGQAIVEDEQQGVARAGYGEQIIQSLSARLKAEGLKGFGRNNLWYMRQFYLTFPDKIHALRGELSWTHYRLLLKVESDASIILFMYYLRQPKILFFEAFEKEKNLRIVFLLALSGITIALSVILTSL